MNANVLLKLFCYGVLFQAVCLGVWADKNSPVELIFIPANYYLPLYASRKVRKGYGDKIFVPAFFMDHRPVSNRQFRKFIRENPKWEKTRIKRIFAEQTYLKHWLQSDGLQTLEQLDEPVVYVSWFAAKNYCRWLGKKLPSTTQWELAFSKNSQELFKSSEPHWEWILDFHTALVTGESRGDSAVESGLFCSGAAVGATNLLDYDAFLRYAFRSGLKADYALPNLGFRCARAVGD